METWREDPNLSNDQRALLVALEAETAQNGGSFGVEVWSKGHAVLDLQGAFSTGSAPGPGKRALKFLKSAGLLWNLAEADFGGRVRVVSEIDNGDCSSADVQLHLADAPIFNAKLHFALRADGTISRVTGFLDATPISQEVEPLAFDEEVARKRLAQAMNWPDEAGRVVPAPSVVVFDPYFVSGEGHSLREAYAFSAGVPSGNSGSLLIDGQLGGLLIHGSRLPDALVVGPVDECDGQQPDTGSAWLGDVVVDPLTGTPAWLSFKHFNGLRVDGVSAEDRVLAMMELLPIRRMFGDAAPREHLMKRGETSRGSTTVLTFDQYFAGVKVDGAYLTATVSAGRVQELFARLPYFPAYKEEGLVDFATASSHARAWFAQLQCGSDATCQANPRFDVHKGETVVFSSQLFDTPWLPGNHLAHKFRFETVEVWWGAEQDAPLFVDNATAHAMPVRVWSPGTQRQLCDAHQDCRKVQPTETIRPPEFKLDIDLDGTAFPPLHADSSNVRSWATTLESRLSSSFGWSGIMGDGGVSETNANASLDIVVGSTLAGGENATAGSYAPHGRTELEVKYIELGSLVTAPDVLAHEFTHHITEATYGPIHFAEQGALSESYSDVVAVAVFEQADGGWDLASESPLGAQRNLLLPRSPHTASGASMIDSVSDKARCDGEFVRDGCTYTWLGIPNLAAARIAVGAPNAVPGTTPFGRLRTAKFYFETIRERFGRFQMQQLDRFLNQRVKLLSLCEMAVDRAEEPVSQRWSSGRAISRDDCRNVARAFDSVGVTAVVRSGFDFFESGRYTGSGSAANYTRTIYAASRLFNGCELTGHVLNLEVRNSELGYMVSRSDTDSPALFIETHRGEVSVQVTDRCGGSQVSGCPDAANRAVTYQAASRWEGQPAFVWVDEQPLSVPAGVSEPDCYVRQLGAARRLYWSTPISFTQSWAALGAKQDQVLSPQAQPPNAACAVRGVGGFDSHREAPLPPPAALASSFSHGSHGFSVSWAGATERDHTALLHTWAEPFSGIFARVVWEVEEPSGVSCHLPGMSPVPEVAP